MSQDYLGSKVWAVRERFILKYHLSRSPVFNAMFIHNMTENQKKEIDIEDLEIETVQDMLK